LMKKDQTIAIDVVLVRPRNPLNIGAVARAMANFDFCQLVVVDAYEPQWRIAKSAVEAEDLMAAALAVPTLAEAVANCTLVVGTGSLTYRRPEQVCFQLPQMAQVLGPLLQREAGGRMALVFGSEKHGLTREDLSWCNALIEIPTSERQPSMNLAQAVAVCLYELRTRVLTTSAPIPESSPAETALTEAAPEPALTAGKNSSADLERLAGLVERTMIAANYSPEQMRAANGLDLRRMLRRIGLTAHDLRRTMGLFRRILWRLER